MQLKYIITGTGRCGTVFMARFLTSLGIPCGHESIFDFRGIEFAQKILHGEIIPKLSFVSEKTLVNDKWIDEPEWLEDITKIEADSSYMAAPFLDNQILENVQIIHVVRNPIKVINSFCHNIYYFQKSEPANKWEEFIYKNLPELRKKMPQYDRAALFYVLWNNMIEKNKINFFYKIEDNVQKILSFLKIKNDKIYENKKINSIKKIKQNFDFNMIQSQEIKKELILISKKYSYKPVYF